MRVTTGLWSPSHFRSETLGALSSAAFEVAHASSPWHRSGSDTHAPDSNRDARRRRVEELLRLVGLSPRHAERYPHEFSGGPRQRVGIARALVMDPDFLVADEPVSALDVSIQAQVINLLLGVRRKLGLTVLFISHDLAAVGCIADRIAVMYLGKIVELAPTKELFLSPRHPYTEALFSAEPIPDPAIRRDRILLKGEIPSPVNPP